MARKKAAPIAEEPVEFFGETAEVEGIVITRDRLERALKDNMIKKLGGHPVEGQVADLWERLNRWD